MGFLELEKYNEDKIEEYKKERWIEFFGNQSYTQIPEKILKQADRIVSRIDWTKEEREMYIVKEGDSLLSIAKNKFGCHKKYFDLIRMNQLESTIIYPGQILRCSE